MRYQRIKTNLPENLQFWYINNNLKLESIDIKFTENKKYSNALINKPQIASRQAFNIYYKKRIIAHEGSEFSIDSETICIHSDTENALKIAKAVKHKLIRS